MVTMPQITRRRALYLMGGVAGGLTLHACTQSLPSSPSMTAEADAAVNAVTGSTLWIGYVPLYIALEKGFFRDMGLVLEHKVMGSSSEADAAFAAGRLHGQNSVTSEAVALASKGQDYRIVQVADSSKGGDGILARSAVQEIADFKGREIAVDVGGVSHFFLLQVLQAHGLTDADVRITNLTPDAAAAAYQAGRVDVAVTYSPFLKQANDAQPDGRIIFDTSQMPTAIMDVYMFSTSFVEQYPDAVMAYVKGIYQAIAFLNSNPDEAHAIAGQWLQLSPEAVATELQGVDLTSLEDNLKLLSDSSSDIYLAEHMVALGDFLKEQGQIPDAPSREAITQLLDPTFVKALATG